MATQCWVNKENRLIMAHPKEVSVWLAFLVLLSGWSVLSIGSRSEVVGFRRSYHTFSFGVSSPQVTAGKQGEKKLQKMPLNLRFKTYKMMIAWDGWKNGKGDGKDVHHVRQCLQKSIKKILKDMKVYDEVTSCLLRSNETWKCDLILLKSSTGLQSM